MLKIGIFGVGHLGKIHVKNWKELSGVQIIGFFDPNDQHAHEVSETFGLKRYPSVSELLHDCDAVDIVSSTTFHFELCKAAIKAGKHVFVEKPLANTMEEARELVKLVKEANVKFQVGHVERFNPAFLAIEGIKKDPMFIEVHRLSQFNPRGTDVSVILDLMIHDIDIVLSLVNSNVKHISANGVAVLSDTPDIANVRIEFDNGCVANLTSSRISMKKMRKIRLFQKDAYIGIDFLEKKAEIIQMGQPENKTAFTFEIDTNHGKKSIAVSNPIVTDGNAIQSELKAFYDAIVDNKETPVTIVDGFRAMDIAHQILAKIDGQHMD